MIHIIKINGVKIDKSKEIEEEQFYINKFLINKCK